MKVKKKSCRTRSQKPGALSTPGTEITFSDNIVIMINLLKLFSILFSLCHKREWNGRIHLSIPKLYAYSLFRVEVDALLNPLIKIAWRRGQWRRQQGAKLEQNYLDGCSVLNRWWQPTPVLLPGESHGQRSLVGCSSWSRKESCPTEWLQFHFSLSSLEKEMATHSSVLAWRIPGMGEPGGLPSMGSHTVGHNWCD